MGFKTYIYSKANSNEYIELLQKYRLDLDIYYHPDFLEYDSEIQKGNYEIFVAEEEENIFIFPYIKLFFDNKDLSSYFDISSPYGYCGPYCNSSFFFSKSEQAFFEYISDKCVTMFVRYHFLYNQNSMFSKDFLNLNNRTIAVLDLKLDWEKIWTEQFSSTNRNLVRRMEREKFEFSIGRDDKDLNEFIDMYYSTMNNVGANKFYFFDKKLLQEVFRKLDSKILLAKVKKDNITYSSSLFFISGGIVTYYLSARKSDFSKIPTTNYLLSESIKYFYNNGAAIFNLGGGLTNELSDALFKFKSNFSKDTLPFIIGKKINNIHIYNQLINQFIKQYGSEAYDSKKMILQFYRN